MEILIWVAFGVLSALVASKKGRSGFAWFLIGVLAGPFGFILALVINDDPKCVKTCPACAETIKQNASVCRYCGTSLNSAMQNQPLWATSSSSTTEAIAMKTCPICSEKIQRSASTCRYCGAAGL